MAEFYVFNNGLMTENTMSGSDQRALSWSRIFSAAGHRITIFTSFPGARRYEPQGFRVFVTGKFFLRSNIGLFLVYVSRAVKSCILQFRIKPVEEGVIYSSSDLLADAAAAVFMKLTRPRYKLIMGMHLIAPNPFRGFRKSYSAGLKIPSLANLYYFLLQRALFPILKKNASLVFVSNHIDKNFLLNKGFRKEQVLVTYGACDVFFKDEKALSAEKSYDAVYVGRFHEQKGFPDLLEIWREVVKELPSVELVVLGEDITAGNIGTFIKKNGLQDNIDFLGFVGGRKKYEYILASKICIFPSYYESFGIVALEAMSCGVPVAAYDLPVFREIYTNGMVTAPIGDIKKMAANAIGLITDDVKRAELSRQALQMSRNFGWEKTAQDILQNLNL